MLTKRTDKNKNRGNSPYIILQSDSKMFKLFQKISIRNLFCFVIISSLSTILLGSNISIDINSDYSPGTSHNHFVMLKEVWSEEINGTENADNITGTINQDIINGLGGNDFIYGKEAGDDISGGDGNDTIFGEQGRDFLRGKSGNDQIDGGEGNDRLFGYNGNDVLIGGPGNDVFIGGSGSDKFICGTGKDKVSDFNQAEGDVIPSNDCETINPATDTGQPDANSKEQQVQQQSQQQVQQQSQQQVQQQSQQQVQQQQEIVNPQNENLGVLDQPNTAASGENIVPDNTQDPNTESNTENGAQTAPEENNPVSNIFKFFK